MWQRIVGQIVANWRVINHGGAFISLIHSDQPGIIFVDTSA